MGLLSVVSVGLRFVYTKAHKKVSHMMGMTR